jgi:hypothetical protein
MQRWYGLAQDQGFLSKFRPKLIHQIDPRPRSTRSTTTCTRSPRRSSSWSRRSCRRAGSDAGGAGRKQINGRGGQCYIRSLLGKHCMSFFMCKNCCIFSQKRQSKNVTPRLYNFCETQAGKNVFCTQFRPHYRPCLYVYICIINHSRIRLPLQTNPRAMINAFWGGLRSVFFNSDPRVKFRPQGWSLQGSVPFVRLKDEQRSECSRIGVKVHPSGPNLLKKLSFALPPNMIKSS